MFRGVSFQSFVNSSESYFKDHYLQSLWAATLQVNSHLTANKYGLGKSETKHLPEIQPLVKKKTPSLC